MAGFSLAIETISPLLGPFCFASRYGDLLAEPDLGVAGGGISTSERGSGDTESAPELSWPYGTGSLL